MTYAWQIRVQDIEHAADLVEIWVVSN